MAAVKIALRKIDAKDDAGKDVANNYRLAEKLNGERTENYSEKEQSKLVDKMDHENLICTEGRNCLAFSASRCICEYA